MQKNLFNDPRPSVYGCILSCASCRSRIRIVVEGYPWGPQGVKYCPVCGTNEADNLHIHDIYELI